MRKVESNLLNTNQFTKITILTMIGIGLLSLPNYMVKEAKQDGWITILISSIYPMYIIFLTIFFSKKHPNENILILSRMYLGNIFGSIMNFIFLLIFIMYLVFELVGIDALLRTYILDFLSNFQFFLVIIPAVAFTTYRGLKVLGRISEVIFYFIIFIGAVTLLSFYRGSYLNVMPIFQNSLLSILKGIKDGLYCYGGIEITLLIYPRIEDKSKIKSSGIYAVLFACITYTWVTFVSIYYFGVNIIKKTLWAGLYIIESFRLPIINNFRLMAMFLYIFISLTIISLYYYSSVFIIRDFSNKASRKLIILVLMPIIMILSLFIGDEIRRREFISIIFPIITIFNIFYVSLIALVIIVKKDKNYEKN